jgi:uncharacterized membrane protein YqjE
MSGPAAGAGLARSLQRLADTAVGIVQLRLELFGTELEQEKRRLYEVLLRAAIGLLLLGLALVLAIGFVVLLFQEGYRLAAVGVLALGFAAGGAWLLRNARDRLDAGDGGPFALSLQELQRDRQGLNDGDAPPPPPEAR